MAFGPDAVPDYALHFTVGGGLVFLAGFVLVLWSWLSSRAETHSLPDQRRSATLVNMKPGSKVKGLRVKKNLMEGYDEASLVNLDKGSKIKDGSAEANIIRAKPSDISSDERS